MSDQNTHPVGYANPPVHSRFKKGRSGNPRGRPKKPEDIYSQMQKVLKRKVKLSDSTQRMTMKEALIYKLRELALSGDRRAMDMQRKILEEAETQRANNPDPEEARREIIDNFERMRAKTNCGEKRDG